MRTYLFCFTIGLWGVLLAGCGATSMSLPTAEQLTANDVAEEVDMGALKRGRALALKECSNCHRFFYPEEYPSASRIHDDEKRQVVPQRPVVPLVVFPK